MSEPAPRRRTVAEFFAWQEGRPDRYELVDGFPVHLMAGAENVHDDIVVNLITQLGNQFRGSGCRPFTGNGSVETLPGRVRRPDAGVDCGRRDPDGYSAAEPPARSAPQGGWPRGSRSACTRPASRRCPRPAWKARALWRLGEAVVWTRDAERNWQRRDVKGLGEVVELAAVKLTLALADLYEGVVFPSSLRLVLSADDGAAFVPSRPALKSVRRPCT